MVSAAGGWVLVGGGGAQGKAAGSEDCGEDGVSYRGPGATC